MSKIFISYRRDDSSTAVGRIYDRLTAHFGRGNVFKDVDSIPLGVDFSQYINTVIQQCAAQVVIIGPHWDDHTNHARLANPGDYVRLEIETALQRGIPVIPVFVQGANFPKADELPPSLRELLMRNGLPVRDDPDFDNDMRRVIASLEKIVPPSPPMYTPPLYQQPVAPQLYPPAPAYKAQPVTARPQNTKYTGLRAFVYSVVALACVVGLIYGGSLLFNNVSLTKQNTAPHVDTTGILYAVAAYSATDIWAAGRTGNTQTQIVHYAGSGQWEVVTTPHVGKITAMAIVPKTNELWVIGSQGFLHDVNGTWTSVAFPPVNANQQDPPQITSLAMQSASEGWATYQTSSQAGLLHYANGTWTVDQAVTYTYEAGTIEQMGAIDQVAVLPDGTGIAYGLTSFYFRQGSGQWKPWSVLSKSGAANNPLNDDLAFLTDLSLISPTEAWAVDRTDDTIDHLVFSGTHWTVELKKSVNLPGAPTQPIDFGACKLNVIAMAPGGQTGWASGYHCGIVQYAHGSWQPQTNTVSNEIFAMLAFSATDGIALGGNEDLSDEGTLKIFRLTNGTWSPMPLQ